MTVEEAKERKILREENTKLKRIVAERMLDIGAVKILALSKF